MRARVSFSTETAPSAGVITALMILRGMYAGLLALECIQVIVARVLNRIVTALRNKPGCFLHENHSFAFLRACLFIAQDGEAISGKHVIRYADGFLNAPRR
jgi:hypothetical protein